ncbi:MAG: lecithin retinol acyltransferase family protein [Nostoc sp. CreGUA01]|nr:lecithin retinol acyltransferase family protein [Nostoc sp. CreGUA01]
MNWLANFDFTTSKGRQNINNILSSTVPIYSALESVVDNYLRDTVTPKPGSIIHCSLYGGEHSGIYIGNGEIIELQGKLSQNSGAIHITNRNGFMAGTNALTVYVASYGDGSEPIGLEEVAQRARASVGQTRKYHLLRNNCHMFVSGCITGNFNNHDNFFINLQDTIRATYGNFNWRAWN